MGGHSMLDGNATRPEVLARTPTSSMSNEKHSNCWCVDTKQACAARATITCDGQGGMVGATFAAFDTMCSSDPVSTTPNAVVKGWDGVSGDFPADTCVNIGGTSGITHKYGAYSVMATCMDYEDGKLGQTPLPKGSQPYLRYAEGHDNCGLHMDGTGDAFGSGCGCVETVPGVTTPMPTAESTTTAAATTATTTATTTTITFATTSSSTAFATPPTATTTSGTAAVSTVEHSCVAKHDGKAEAVMIGSFNVDKRTAREQVAAGLQKGKKVCFCTSNRVPVPAPVPGQEQATCANPVTGEYSVLASFRPTASHSKDDHSDLKVAAARKCFCAVAGGKGIA